MRYALFADIHANLPALEAVLADSRTQSCAKVAFLGDLVNYGRHSRESVELIQELNAPGVLGNHDEACSYDPSGLRYLPKVERMFRSTSSQLNRTQRAWLRQLPLVQTREDFTLVHANLWEPGKWGYVVQAPEAASSFARLQTTLCFFGHTHLQRVFVGPSVIRSLPPARLELDPERKYLINVGSVGLSRDPDPRAAYCIYAAAQRRVEFRRVAYEDEHAHFSALEAHACLSEPNSFPKPLVAGCGTFP